MAVMFCPSTVKQNISVTIETDKSCRKVLRPESDPEEECVCSLKLHLAAGHATPKSRPASTENRKTAIRASRALNWIQGAMQHDWPEPEPWNCSLLQHFRMSNKTTDDRGHYYYQLISAANQVNFSMEIGCKLQSFCSRLIQNLPDPSDFLLTVTQLKCWQNMKASTFHFGSLFLVCGSPRSTD